MGGCGGSFLIVDSPAFFSFFYILQQNMAYFSPSTKWQKNLHLQWCYGKFYNLKILKFSSFYDQNLIVFNFELIRVSFIAIYARKI